jgi:ribosomal protein S18 acetylase RimI-like enzyme
VTIGLRTATLADFDGLTALWRAMDELHARILPGYFRRTAVPPKSRAEVERILAAPDERLRVAAAGAGPLVGVCHALLYETPPTPAMTPTRRAHIDSIVVDAAARRCGLGRRLVADVEAWARARGAHEVILTVWAGNAEAEAFYESLGFGAVNRVLGKRLL